MKQIISDSIPTRFGYKVDKPFIDQVISIIQTASKQATFEIKVHAGSETYTFDSPAEFYDSVVTITHIFHQTLSIQTLLQFSSIVIHSTLLELIASLMISAMMKEIIII